MINQFRTSIVLVIFNMCLFFIGCDENGNPFDSDQVNNTNFEAEEPFNFEVDVVNHIQLTLSATNGNITITGMPNTNSVSIGGEKKVGSESIDDAEAHLSDIEVNVSDLSDEVLVETNQPQTTQGRNYIVNYTITLPQFLKVSVESVNGTVIIKSINNLVDVVNVNGQIKLDEIFASTFVELVNGVIEGNISMPLAGTIDLKTTNGGVDLDIPRSTSASFSAKVTNGLISVSNLDLKDIVSTNTSFTGTLADGQGSIILHTINGNISVTGF
jgi:DUF4097 and DUF4098 domain-containing protein YvlB